MTPKAHIKLYEKICPYCQGDLYYTGDSLRCAPDLNYITALYTCNECNKTIAIHFKAHIVRYSVIFTRDEQ